MDKNYRRKIAQDLEKKLTNWKIDFNTQTLGKPFLEIIKSVSLEISLSVLITSYGKNNLVGYCGPYYKCKKLQKKFEDGWMEPVGYLWCWFGYGKPEEMQKTLTADGFSKLKLLKVSEQDVEDLTRYLSCKMSLQHTFGKEGTIMTYLGSRAVCVRLKHQYKGKIGRIGDIWHWIGQNICSLQINEVANSYSTHAKRCNKKGIVDD